MRDGSGYVDGSGGFVESEKEKTQKEDKGWDFGRVSRV